MKYFSVIREWSCMAVLIFLTTSGALSQGVGINSSNGSAHPSAGLDVDFTDRGMLIPRMTQDQRDAISNPATGLQIYNTDTDCLNMWNGSGWKKSCYDCDFALPLVSNNGPVCEGATFNLSVSTVPGATYEWSGPNGFASTDQNPSIANVTSDAAGLYAVVVTQNGCSTQPLFTTASIKDKPAIPVADFETPLCEGGIVQLTTPLISGALYQWSGPNGFSAVEATPSLSNATSAMDGTYSVTVEIDGCTSSPGSTSITVNGLPSPSFSYLPSSPSTANSVVFTPSLSGASYQWTFSGGNPATSTSETPSVNWSTSGNYSASLTITDGNGCTNSSGTTLTVTDPIYRVFITSTSYNGNLGGLSGADNKCQTHADNASLGGTWKAWLSTGSVNAKDRIANGIYRKLNGQTIATSISDLTDGSINTPIDNTETGATNTDWPMWTGTNASGTVISGGHCSDWTSSGNGASGYIGDKNATGSTWTNAYNSTTWSGCATNFGRIYCFEQ